MTSATESFRAEVRTWLEENCPLEMRTPMTGDEDVCWGGRKFTFTSLAQQQWLEAMASRGWTAPKWPVEYGGGGLSDEHADILAEELGRLGARSPLSSVGIWMLGPAILRYGTEEQKRQHLPKIARGEIRWCQGYSEPGAGSDLASIRTRAERHDDHYLVNGQKIWTSHGDHADWIFCLVRTDPNAPKHRGISFLMFDMETQGVTVRPLTLISGVSHFTETFFDDVKVPTANILGEENAGWEIAKYLLGHEREMIGNLRFKSQEPENTVDAAIRLIGVHEGRLLDPVIRTDLSRIEMDAAALALTAQRWDQEKEVSDIPPTASSVLKFVGTELNKRRTLLRVDIGGTDALDWRGATSNNGVVVRSWLRSYGSAIAGGTSEIQLNIIAKRQLGLPGA